MTCGASKQVPNWTPSSDEKVFNGDRVLKRWKNHSKIRMLYWVKMITPSEDVSYKKLWLTMIAFIQIKLCNMIRTQKNYKALKKPKQQCEQQISPINHQQLISSINLGIFHCVKMLTFNKKCLSELNITIFTLKSGLPTEKNLQFFWKWQPDSSTRD